jgi:hypothetical protein
LGVARGNGGLVWNGFFHFGIPTKFPLVPNRLPLWSSNSHVFPKQVVSNSNPLSHILCPNSTLGSYIAKPKGNDVAYSSIWRESIMWTIFGWRVNQRGPSQTNNQFGRASTIVMKSKGFEKKYWVIEIFIKEKKRKEHNINTQSFACKVRGWDFIYLLKNNNIRWGVKLRLSQNSL